MTQCGIAGGEVSPPGDAHLVAADIQRCLALSGSAWYGCGSNLTALLLIREPFMHCTILSLPPRALRRGARFAAALGLALGVFALAPLGAQPVLAASPAQVPAPSPLGTDSLTTTAGTVAPPVSASGAARATTVRGTLSPGGYHYLGLEPSLRDGTVVLTLALEPSDDVSLRGAINFLVLTADGLRRVLAGADPFDLDIAASAPLQFDPIGNKYQAVFSASGKGPYTVIVYNTGGKVGGYTLTALNAVLLDDSGQVNVVAAAPEPLNPPSLEASTTPTETMEARVSISKGSPLAVSAAAGTVTQPAPSVNAVRLSGVLDGSLNRHFLNLQPSIRDGNVDIEMVFEPRGRETEGFVNFYILDQDALRRFVYGDDFDAVELAAGAPKPFSSNPNDLVAQFTASGSNEYTVVPFSLSPLTVTYVMNIAGGQLIDRYGQTNEAAAARAEFAALSAAANAADAGATAAATATVPVTSTLPDMITPTAAVPAGAPGEALVLGNGSSLSLADLTPVSSGVVVDAPIAGAALAASGALDLAAPLPEITGVLPTAYAHNYWSLIPAIRDGVVVLTLDYAPRDQEALKNNINFWVVDEDGMRRIVSGARPEDQALAGGSEVQFGPDKGKLQAAFQSSGKGTYAVIVYNNSAVPATYTIATSGATLLAPPADSDLVQLLP
jgi:hypothetical protein